MFSALLSLTMLLACGIESPPTSNRDGAGDRASRKAASASRCEPVSRFLLNKVIAEGLTVRGRGSLRDGYAVRSKDFQKVWFLAAEIDGPGLRGDGDIGLWATNAPPATNSYAEYAGLMFSVDSVAKEFSDWGAGDTSDAQITQFDDGAQEARECAES